MTMHYSLSRCCCLYTLLDVNHKASCVRFLWPVNMFSDRRHALNFFNHFDQSSSSASYIFHGLNSVSAEEGDWPVVTMITDASCLYDVSVYITDPI